MTPHRLLDTAIKPALAELAARGIPDSLDARRILLAIALQESGLRHRRQVSSDGTESGPAVSFWQGEKGGGMCKGVLTHRGVAPLARQMCEDFNVEPTSAALWEAIRYHDILAAGMARLLVYTLPWALPTTAADGWQQYSSKLGWNPGKPRPGTWAANWDAATLTVGLTI